MEQTKFTRFKRIANKKFISILAILMILFGSIYLMAYNKPTTKVNQKSIKTEYVLAHRNVIKIDTIQIKDSIQNKLVEEVSQYIKRQAPRSHQFIPKYLVKAGLENNIDICFMMAQTQIETCYGTTGAGRESSRRSMFGITKRRYPNYENAIDHYCDILKKYYLVKGRTEQHLMAKYVTGTGGRYAGNPRYEMELRMAYNQIKRATDIYDLQSEYKKF